MAKNHGSAKAGDTQAAWNDKAAGVKALHVMLLPDGAGWFAQGLEIDYAASGKTVEEVKNNFGQGLAMTLCEHLMMYGHIKKALVLAPQEAWEEYYNAPTDKIQKHSCDLVAFLVEHAENKKPTMEQVEKFVPFNVIEFVKGQAEATV